MKKDFVCPLEQAAKKLRIAKATGKLEDFQEIEKTLAVKGKVGDVDNMDTEELEIYLQASLHIAAIRMQTEEGSATEPDMVKDVHDRCQIVLKYDIRNPHAYWLRGMALLKLNKAKDGLESLEAGLRLGKRLGINEVNDWEKEYNRLCTFIEEQKAKYEKNTANATSSSSTPKAAPKIEELDSDEIEEKKDGPPVVQKGFFNTKKKEVEPKSPEVSGKNPQSPKTGIKKDPISHDNLFLDLQTFLNNWKKEDRLQRENDDLKYQRELGDLLKKEFSEIIASHLSPEKLQENYSDLLNLVEDKIDAVPGAIESIRKEAEELKEVEESLKKQIQASNQDSIKLKQETYEVLQETRKIKSACDDMNHKLQSFISDGQDVLRNNSNNKMGSVKEKLLGDAQIIEVPVLAFKQQKVWMAMILSFLAGFCCMLGIVVEVYSAWGCEFHCKR